MRTPQSLPSLRMTGKQSDPKPSFRAVLALPGHKTWYAASALIRLPVVMAPLALVFLGHATHSFAAGGLLAATHAIGEAAGAPLMGRRFDTRPFLGQLRLSLAAEGAAFAVIALIAGHAPVVLLAALTFLAGAAASGAPGGMRAQLSATSPEHLRPAALGLESALSQTTWAVAPPLVALVYTRTGAAGALLVMAVSSAAPLLFARRIPHTERSAAAVTDGAATGTRTREILRTVWPTALLSVAIMFLIGTADVLLPPRLEENGASPALAGPVMTAFAVASIVSGLVYGARRWPGSPFGQTACLLPLFAGAFALPAWTGAPWHLTAAFALGGLLFSPLMVIRNIALQHRLPQQAWATGFSVLYAAAGVGYGAAGLLSAALLGTSTPGNAFLVCALVTAVIGGVSLAGERVTRTSASPAAVSDPPVRSER
ncbi:Predicted arabinose efflux permease, MFS family [Streptomyces sp. SolWspMP-5a-2]|nr:Predicted arabinose efflux permease, MFS family [Streptomyces sp. SolWspMP-5a-2]